MTSPTKTTTDTMTLAERLGRIGMRAAAGSLDDLIARATTARWGAGTLLEELTRIELADRGRRSLERRLRRSRVGRFKPIADFDWNWPKKIDRLRLEQILALGFLREDRNLVLMGPNGVGRR
jgi:DNA replication protein DnaC